MRETKTLAAQARAKTGKGPAYQSRLKGLIPGIVYGGKDAPQPVSVSEADVTKLYYTGTMLSTLLMLDIEGKKGRVIPRQIQLDPVTDRIVHVDFMRLADGARISLAIPVHFKNQDASPGIKVGGVLNIVRHEVELYCPVDDIPAFIEVDLTGLEIGDAVHISSIKLPEGARPVIRDRDFTVATIAPPTTYVEEAPVAAAAAATPAEGEAAAAEGAAAPAAGAAAAGAAPAGGAKAPAKK